MKQPMSLKSAFAGMQEAAPARLAEVPKSLSTGRPKGLAGRAAKSCDPDYEQLKVYVRGETKKRAWRKWEDATGLDLSDLVEKLLQEYLGT